MRRQMSLPGASVRISHRLLLAIIRDRLKGLKTRQMIREMIRRRRGCRSRRLPALEQLELFANE